MAKHLVKMILDKKSVATHPPVSKPRISQGHVIKGSCDVIGRSASREVIILSSFVTIGTLLIEI